MKAQIREEALHNNFEPDVMEVLNRMSLTPIAAEEEEGEEDGTRDVIEQSIH